MSQGVSMCETQSIQRVSENDDGNAKMSLEAWMIRQEEAIERLRMHQDVSFEQLRKHLDKFTVKHLDVRQSHRLSGSVPEESADIEQLETYDLTSAMTTAMSSAVSGRPIIDTTTSASLMSCDASDTTVGKTFSMVESSKKKKARAEATRLASVRTMTNEDIKQSMDSDFLSFVRTARFENVIGILLTAHAIFVGFQVDLLFANKQPTYVEVIEFLFCLAFVVEILVRMLAYGLYVFFRGKEAAWNIFDFVVVLLSQIYAILSLSSGDHGSFQSIQVLRYVRFLRLTRVLRIIRMLRSFRHLRTLTAGLLSSLWSASWTLLLLFIVIYIFGILIAQNVAYHVIYDDGANQSEELLQYFGSLTTTIATLFMSIAGGIDWESAVIPLTTVSWFTAALFIVYAAFTILCLMNVVTGIFCEGAIEAAQKDKEHMIDLQLADRSNMVNMLEQVFKSWDLSGDGDITIEEFESHLTDDRVVALFETLEVMASDAWTLFKLLDSDGSGYVDADEFVAGCIRLRGGAKAVHIEKLNYEIKWLMDKVSTIANKLSDPKPQLHQTTQDIKSSPKSLRIASAMSQFDVGPTIVASPPSPPSGSAALLVTEYPPSHPNMIEEVGSC